MAKLRDLSVKLVLCLIIIITIFHLSVGDDHQTPEEGATTTTTGTTVRERVMSMFSLSPTTTSGATSYWEKVKMMVQQAHGYFFPPNLEGSDERGDANEEGGAGKKVKEAAAKSMEKSKSTVEHSAKTAANTVHMTAEKVKKTLSGTSQPDSTSEL